MARLVIDRVSGHEPCREQMQAIDTNMVEVYADIAAVVATKQTGFTLAAHADNAAAKVAGLVDGDLFHTAGVVYMVYTP